MKETVTVGLDRYQQLLECEKGIRNEFSVCVRLPNWSGGTYFFRKRDDIVKMAKEISESASYRDELLSELAKSREELERIKSHWLVRLFKIK